VKEERVGVVGDNRGLMCETGAYVLGNRVKVLAMHLGGGDAGLCGMMSDGWRVTCDLP